MSEDDNSMDSPLPGMKWDDDNPLGVPVPVLENAPVAGNGPAEPADVGGEFETDTAAGGDFDMDDDFDVDAAGMDDTAAALASAIASLKSAQAAYNDAQDAEDCGFCIAMMDALRETDFETQIAGLEELHEIESADGQVTQAELDEKMEDFEIIPRFAQAAMQAQQDD